jgi:enoyl-CoA hydratase/carnithine racemase
MVTSSLECITVDRREAVAWVTLNRPRALNSLSPRLIEELNLAIQDIADDPQVRACVITGTGRAFSTGGDLKALEDFAAAPATVADRTARYLESIGTTLRRLEQTRVPTIAAVNGLALAGGLELVLCCDLVIASEDAMFGDVHATYGLLPGGGGSVRLPRKVGVNRAKYLMFTAEQVSASVMMDWGLVCQVVPAAQLQAAAEHLALRIADKSPLALARMKQLVDNGMQQSVEAALQLEQAVVVLHNGSHDRNEGLSAFKERRKPVFSGN